MMKAMVKRALIRKILFQKNLSQNWLAKKLGISSGYMAQLLNGERCPSPEMRQKIQSYFTEHSFDELFRAF